MFDYAVVQGDHAVGHVLLEAVTGDSALTALGRHDGGDALRLQPAEEAAQLGSELCRVVEGGEEDLECVEHHPLRPVSSMANPILMNSASRSQSPVWSIRLRSTFTWSSTSMPSAAS